MTTNATLVTTNATLTAEIKKLTAEIVRLKAQAGSSGAGTPQGTRTAQQAGNLAGVMCPVEKGKGGRKGLTNRLYFVEKKHCATCGFEVRHLSAHCPQTKEGKKRKTEVLAKKAAEAAAEGYIAVGSLVVSNVNTFEEQTLGCDAPPRPNTSTALLDSAASVTCMGKEANCQRAKEQVPNVTLNTPSNVPIHTMKALELLMKKLPPAARKATE